MKKLRVKILSMVFLAGSIVYGMEHGLSTIEKEDTNFSKYKTADFDGDAFSNVPSVGNNDKKITIYPENIQAVASSRRKKKIVLVPANILAAQQKGITPILDDELQKK